MACFSFLSIGQVQLPDASLDFTTMGFAVEGESTGGPVGEMETTWSFFILSLMSAVVPFVAIFLFKNLKLQMTLCLVEVLFLVAVIADACYIGYCSFPGYAPGWSTLALAPFLSIILCLMAWRRIRKDRNLLRSADRIR